MTELPELQIDERLFRPIVFRGSTKRVLDQGFVKLVDWMGGDDAIVQAARASEGEGIKTAKEDKRLIGYLMKNRHTSPFEMVEFKFHVAAPIFVFRQWHRHRTWSYNEISARYTEMADKHYAADPARMTTQDAKNHQASTTLPVADAEEAAALLNMAHEVTYSIYETLLGMGVNRETARRALTFDLYSEMYAKVDLHNLLGFLALRTDSHAQQEIREYANAMLELIQPVVPWAIEAWEKNRDTWREYETWRLSMTETKSSSSGKRVKRK